MLGMSSYPQAYIDDCKARVESQLATYRKSAPKNGDLDAAFFNNLVIVLDSFFMHRLRGKEGKDGNPLNEVRVLVGSMMANGERLMFDKQIKLDPAKSVLGLDVGDPIALSEADFVALSKAFFREIESRFAE
jgi:hypothetical protein